MTAILRAQLSAAIATAMDVGVTVCLAGPLTMAPAPAGVCGNVSGGAVNFLINRRWAYPRAGVRWQRQAWRYLLVWCGYVALGYALMLLGTRVLAWHYLLVKVITVVVMGPGYNHLLHKYYVFS